MKNFFGLLDILQVPLKITQDFVSLVIFPPATNYFVASFTNLDLINFMLLGFFFKSLANKVAQIPYLWWLHLLLS